MGGIAESLELNAASSTQGCLLPADHNRFVASCAETRGLSSDYAEGSCSRMRPGGFFATSSRAAGAGPCCGRSGPRSRA